MKKFCLVLLAVFMMISSNCFAMTFSQPIYIGEAIPHYQREAYGLFIKDETYKNASYYTEFIKDNKIGYGKGIAKFDKGLDEIYFFFDYHHSDKKSVFKFGSKNIKNTTDSGITFYEIAYHVYRISLSSIIGRRNDGKWIK